MADIHGTREELVAMIVSQCAEIEKAYTEGYAGGKAEMLAALEAKDAEIKDLKQECSDLADEVETAFADGKAELEPLRAEIAKAKEDRAAYERWTAEIKDVVDALRAENVKLTERRDSLAASCAKYAVENVELRKHLKMALRQWVMYADMVENNDGFDLMTEQSPEAETYRTAHALANEQTATGGSK